MPKPDVVLYVDATSGVSGDMLLGAFLDLEIPVEVLHTAWSALPLDNYEVEISEIRKAGMRALRCKVETDEKSGPRSWKDFEKALRSSGLQSTLRDQTLMLCRRLFEIESHIHGISLERMHLHEMGGTDLLIDVLGSLAAIDFLQPVHVCCSPVNTGRGFVSFSHGRYPVPTPAVADLLQDIPIFQNEVDGELTTPTGALLVSHLAQSFGVLPEMTLQKIGVGAGEKEIKEHPNVTRLLYGSRKSISSDEDVYQVEINIDDSTPQLLGHFMEVALEAGALDVFFQPILMKKNRPAVCLSLLTERSNFEKVASLVFTETSAIGMRYWKVEREKLERCWREVFVDKQKIRIKESYREGKCVNFQPEYEDCKAAATALGVPLKEISSRAVHEYRKKTKMR